MVKESNRILVLSLAADVELVDEISALRNCNLKKTGAVFISKLYTFRFSPQPIASHGLHPLSRKHNFSLSPMASVTYSSRGLQSNTRQHRKPSYPCDPAVSLVSFPSHRGVVRGWSHFPPFYFTLEFHAGCLMVAYLAVTSLAPPRMSHTHSSPGPDRSCSRSGRCRLALVAAKPEVGLCQMGRCVAATAFFFFFADDAGTALLGRNLPIGTRRTRSKTKRSRVEAQLRYGGSGDWFSFGFVGGVREQKDELRLNALVGD